MTDRDSVRAAVAAGTERFGGVDALVNNAGVLLFGAIEDLREDEIHVAMDTNFVAHIRTAQAVLPQMRDRGAGKIINVEMRQNHGPFGWALLRLEARP